MLNPRQSRAYQALGITNERLPQHDKRTHHTVHDGVTIWIDHRITCDPPKSHRVMCQCRQCGRVLSYARLPQHLHSHNRALWRTVASGVIPCTVLSRDTDPYTGMTYARIRINRTQGPYRKGEIVCTSASFITAR